MEKKLIYWQIVDANENNARGREGEENEVEKKYDCIMQWSRSKCFPLVALLAPKWSFSILDHISVS